MRGGTFALVQAQYAFVIHTVNPSNGNEGEIYAELVAGLGESIVSGMVPGASLAFVGDKTDLDNPRVRRGRTRVLGPGLGVSLCRKHHNHELVETGTRWTTWGAWRLGAGYRAQGQGQCCREQEQETGSGVRFAPRESWTFCGAICLSRYGRSASAVNLSGKPDI